MKIHLSNYSYLRNFGVFLDGFDATEPNRLQITTNARWIQVHPGVLTVVAALGLTLSPDNITFDDITARSGYYLDRMGLFKILGKKSPFAIQEHESSGRFIPITQIRTPEEQTKFISDMVPLLHLEPAQADAIKYVVGELVRNVLEHSSSPNGAVVAAQYSAKSKVMRIGICDTGMGIRKSLARSWHSQVETDSEAIQWALVPGVSGTTTHEGGTADNAGAGLFFIKSIAMLTRDYFVVYSGSGVYRLLKRRPDVRLITLHADPAKDRHAEHESAPYLPGTLIAIDISIDRIEEFSSLLSTIRDSYTSAVRERKKARYKRPQFRHKEMQA